MGLHERYPWFTRTWLLEGVGVAILFPLVQVMMIRDFSNPLIGILIVGIMLALLGAYYWINQRWVLVEETGRSTTPTPNLNQWHTTIFAGVIALAIGLQPVMEQLPGENLSHVSLMLFSMYGVGYLFLGQLLDSYHIRKTDRYAIYAGGLWMLVLIAAIPNIPVLREWSIAVLGLGMAIHHISAYIYLSSV